MSFKSDVKPVFISSTSSNVVLFTGPTRFKRISTAQSTGIAGTAVINALANVTTV